MHALSEYLARQLADHLKKHRIVVFYDPRKEFCPFIEELKAAERTEDGKLPVGELFANYIRFDGSFFEVRAKAEPLVSIVAPEPLLIYVLGVERDRKGSVLMELELAGKCYEPQLKRIARHVLSSKRFTDGVIDEMLRPERIDYADVVSFLEQKDDRGEGALLKTIFTGASGNAQILAAWIAMPENDAKIEEKGALGELIKLLEHRLGLTFDPVPGLDSLRTQVARYVLINEFRLDLASQAPASLEIVPSAGTEDQQALVRDVAEAIREKFPEKYVEIADHIEAQFNLGQLKITAEHLGRIDTFRFEERALLAYTYKLIAVGKYPDALKVVTERQRGFWVRQSVERQLRWTTCQVMAELGARVLEVSSLLGKLGSDSAAWVAAYTAEAGWHRADSAHRNLEALLVQIDEEPGSEAAVNRVRQAYEELLQRMAVGFGNALQASGWTVSGALHQTEIYPNLVEKTGARVAYFVVDALRYEMGVELRNLLEGSKDLTLRPAVAALPTITPVGMAALLPRASASFDVVEELGALAARVDGVPLKDLAARMKFLKARMPGAIDLELGKLLQMTSGKLKSTLGTTSLVVVRSQEIDKIGEMDGDFIARQVMDTVLQNVARAVRKVIASGIEYVVIAADHGYQFTREKEESYRTDKPGGNPILLHRRCWVGHGAATPSGASKVVGPDLGYDTDLEFIFPTGIGVFKAGGSLAYHHGGTSLQELIVPVLTLRGEAVAQGERSHGKLRVKGYPKELNNRTFGVTIELDAEMFRNESVVVRPVLMAGGVQVGEAGMALDAPFDREAKTVTIEPGGSAIVAMLLRREDCPTIRVALLDPTTDSVLDQSEEITVRLGV